MIYNFFIIEDARNITNTGWHICTDTERDNLETYIGGTAIGGGKLKYTGTTYWDAPNLGATNEYGFNCKGSGERNYLSGAFVNKNIFCRLWTDHKLLTTARSWLFNYNSINMGNVTYNLKGGQAIRIVKDTTSLIHGQTGFYIGNDGKIYRTICIGTDEWLADNLAETKYRNGDNIPEVINAVTWAGLTTGAMCAYNNDWNNV